MVWLGGPISDTRSGGIRSQKAPPRGALCVASRSHFGPPKRGNPVPVASISRSWRGGLGVPFRTPKAGESAPSSLHLAGPCGPQDKTPGIRRETTTHGHGRPQTILRRIRVLNLKGPCRTFGSNNNQGTKVLSRRGPCGVGGSSESEREVRIPSASPPHSD